MREADTNLVTWNRHLVDLLNGRVHPWIRVSMVSSGRCGSLYPVSRDGIGR